MATVALSERAEPAFSDRLALALKEAAIAALIAGALVGPLLGLRTAPAPGGTLSLTERWWAVGIAVAIVFAGRLVLRLFLWRPGVAGIVLPRSVSAVFALIGRRLGPILLGLALVWPIIPVLAGGTLDRYLLDLGITVLTYVMLAWGLNIVVGLAGLLDLGYVAFYAVGAYSFALLAQYGIPYPVLSASAPFLGIDFAGLGAWAFWVCLPLAGLLAALWGVILGFPVLRLRGDYLAIVTLAFGEIIRIVLLNWYEFTGGPNGLSSIPSASFFGIPFNASETGFAATFGLEFSPNQKYVFLFYLILALAMLTYVATNRLRRLPIGRAWEALREDEIACRSLGINTRNTKLTAFAIGAMFGGFAGAFFATKQQFISPESFNFMESALILAIVVLGGLGNQVGIVLAAIAMMGGIELLRNLNFLKAIFGPEFDPSLYRMLIFGLAMVAIMVWRPRGLVSERTPSIALGEKKAIGADLRAEGRG